jgi:hypothetical protein
MPRDRRRKHDLHALDANGMVLCNPRDKMEGIATDAPNAVTCRKCLTLLHKLPKNFGLKSFIANSTTTAPITRRSIHGLQEDARPQDLHLYLRSLPAQGCVLRVHRLAGAAMRVGGTWTAPADTGHTGANAMDARAPPTDRKWSKSGAFRERTEGGNASLRTSRNYVRFGPLIWLAAVARQANGSSR